MAEINIILYYSSNIYIAQTGFFLLQIYTPLTMIVFCSWVSFCLIKTEKGGEVPARTALGKVDKLKFKANLKIPQSKKLKYL